MSCGNTDEQNGQVHQIHLKGHTAPVLCLDHSCKRGLYRPHNNDGGNYNNIDTQSSLLMSGSEDGTARLWDLRTSNKASLCILSPTPSSEITSVAFSPPQLMMNSHKNDASSNSQTNNPFSKDVMVYISSGSDVYGYDLRNASIPIIRNYDFSLSSVLENEDIVNQLAFSESRNKKSESNHRFHLAAADDNGEVRITDCIFHQSDNDNKNIDNKQQNKNRKVGNKGRNYTKSLQHAQDGAALVTSIGFRPRAKGLDLATGGTDCKILLWDITRPWKPSFSFQIEQNDAGTNQVCNPPMVHSLAWSPSGRLLSSGLGDGSCLVLSSEGRRLSQACRLEESHDAAVACILFPNFGIQTSSHITAEDRLMISAGNDGVVLLWDLGDDICGKHAVNPSTMFRGCESNQPNAGQTSLENDMASMIIDSHPKILFGIPHQKKPNWIVNSTISSSALPTTLFVADVSNDITAYTLPYQ